MNGGVSNQPQKPVPVAHHVTHAPANAYSHLTPEQQARIQEDLADRERQASALAHAGMVADSVSLTRPAASVGQVLQAPPPLGALAPPVNPTGDNGHPPMESINWNLDVGLGGGLDDMDMDFANLFDTETEQNFMMDMNSGSLPSVTAAVGGPAPPVNGGNEGDGQGVHPYGTSNPLDAAS
jgi:hypothetical protein